MKRIKTIRAELKEYVKNLLSKYPEINTISIEVDITGSEAKKDISIFEINEEEKEASK